ncbi:kinase-like domain-containing protein [Aspergillus californicus]
MPDDHKEWGRQLSENDPPTIAKDNTSGLAKEDQAVFSGVIADAFLYEPPFTETLSQGSASLIARVSPGVVVKVPRYSWWHSEAASNHPFVKGIRRNFEVEEQLLDILGIHPRIIRYIGVSEEPRGLLFAEASDGNLQAYIDRHDDTIDLSLRLKWCSQAAEAIQYTHQKGVIHSDLRPENFLLHKNPEDTLDLLLCDFGGLTNGGIDGGHVPDSGFFNPCKPWVSTEAMDIFSLGSVFYTITAIGPTNLLGHLIRWKK